ncbi:unnamed protein product [Prorocentrum cordatum]|uniref:Uncharacterized protein n=1 Tax=Prorocentrum cordatum TaxID=2364126 RepID=A0ABN9RGI7_9DINO|nr:unnamed protein product [Polarella glacialis]
MAEPVVTLDGANKVMRWCWMADWRCFVPVWFPVAGEGKYPFNPLPKQIKQELVESFSHLRSAFTDDEAQTAIKLFATKRGERQWLYNEDPDIGDEFPDNGWVVNKKTAIAVVVDWPTGPLACDQKGGDGDGDKQGNDSATDGNKQKGNGSANDWYDDQYGYKKEYDDYKKQYDSEYKERLDDLETAGKTSAGGLDPGLRLVVTKKAFKTISSKLMEDAVGKACKAGFRSAIKIAQDQQLNESSREPGNSSTSLLHASLNLISAGKLATYLAYFGWSSLKPLADLRASNPGVGGATQASLELALGAEGRSTRALVVPLWEGGRLGFEEESFSLEFRDQPEAVVRLWLHPADGAGISAAVGALAGEAVVPLGPELRDCQPRKLLLPISRGFRGLESHTA